MKKGFSLPLVIGLLIGMLLVLIGFSFRHSKNKTEVSIPTAPTQEESVENSLSPSPMSTNNIQAKFMGKEISTNVSFVNSKGENRRLIVISPDGGNNKLYITDANLNENSAISVKFTHEVFSANLYTTAPSPGKIKYFHIMGSAGDFGKSAIIDENGNVLTENLYEETSKRDGKFFGRIIDKEGNSYNIALDTNGNITSIDKI